MVKKSIFSVGVIALALAVACSKSENPAAPSSSALSDAAAAADGSTLKIAAPTLVSPVNGAQNATDSTLLVLTNVSATYSASLAIVYEVEIRNDLNTVVANPKFAKAGGSTTSF